jgi:hypothetical protein
LAVRVGISQIVHVVSIEDVIINFGDNVFQSREVKGAVCSGVLLFDSNASGCNFCGAGSLRLAEALRLMLLVTWDAADCGRLQSRR